jgi:hypothetical protein
MRQVPFTISRLFAPALCTFAEVPGRNGANIPAIGGRGACARIIHHSRKTNA